MCKEIKIRYDRTISIDVDAQKGFTPLCPNDLPVEGGDLIVDELNKNALFAKYRMGSKDNHPSNASWIATDENPIFSAINDGNPNVDIRWPAHCISGTTGVETLPGLPMPINYDYFIWKGMEHDLHPYGIFYHDIEERLSTGATEWIQCNNIDTFIIGGLALEYCVYKTITQLASIVGNDCRIILNLSATAAIDGSDAQKVMEDLISLGVIIIDSTDELNLIV